MNEQNVPKKNMAYYGFYSTLMLSHNINFLSSHYKSVSISSVECMGVQNQ
jgi:hypothetical protein